MNKDLEQAKKEIRKYIELSSTKAHPFDIALQTALECLDKYGEMEIALASEATDAECQLKRANEAEDELARLKKDYDENEEEMTGTILSHLVRIEDLDAQIARLREERDSFSDMYNQRFREVQKLRDRLYLLREGLPTKAELHEIWHKETGDEITLSIAKGLKAIYNRLHKEKK